MPSTTVVRGNILFSQLCALTLSPAIVNANTAVEQSFALPGVQKLTDFVNVSKPTVQAGLSIGNVRVVSDGVIGVQFVNGSGGNITPTALESYTFNVDRYENAGQPLPASVV